VKQLARLVAPASSTGQALNPLAPVRDEARPHGVRRQRQVLTRLPAAHRRVGRALRRPLRGRLPEGDPGRPVVPAV